MELIDIVDWGGPCAIATRNNGDGTECVVGAFRAGIQTYLMNSTTCEKIDSGRVLHPIIPGEPVDVFWQGDSLFAFYDDAVMIYNLASPLSPISTGVIPIYEIYPEYELMRVYWGDSAIFIEYADTITHEYWLGLFDRDLMSAGVCFELIRHNLDYPSLSMDIIGSNIYISQNRCFYVVQLSGSSLDTIFYISGNEDYYFAINGDVIFLSCYNDSSYYIFLTEYLISPDTLYAHTRDSTYYPYVYGSLELFKGRTEEEFLGTDIYCFYKLQIGHECVSIERIQAAYPNRIVSSESNVYLSFGLSWKNPGPSLAYMGDTSICDLMLNESSGRMVVLSDSTFIKGGSPIRIYEYGNPDSLHTLAQLLKRNEFSPIRYYSARYYVQKDTLILFWIGDTIISPELFDISVPDTFVRMATFGWIWPSLDVDLGFVDSFVYAFEFNVVSSSYFYLFKAGPLNILTALETHEFELPGACYGAVQIDNYFIHNEYSDGLGYVYTPEDLVLFIPSDTIPGIFLFPYTRPIQFENSILFKSITHDYAFAVKCDSTGLTVTYDSLFLEWDYVDGYISDSIIYEFRNDKLFAHKMNEDFTIHETLDSLKLASGNILQIGDYLYVSTNYGLAIVDISDLTNIEETDAKTVLPVNLNISTYPNPFNSECLIHGPESAEISIMSIDGRSIEKLTLDKTGFGHWSPSEEIATGVYLIKSKENGQTAKAVFIK